MGRALLFLLAGLAFGANPLLDRLEVRNASLALTGLQEVAVTADVYGTAPADFTLVRARLRRATLGGLPCQVAIPVQRKPLRRGRMDAVARGVEIRVSLASLQFPWTVVDVLSRGTVELRGDLEVEWETAQPLGALGVLRGSGTYQTRLETRFAVARAALR
ncbi:MAG TPA: hypothetical protein VFQ91_14050 [Bryobacteraceae bacterium]|nr:hypothetical protein [Bryobacteraceae bacterium]